ncbi:MAG: tetraacyldisaccharide 4'-kinase [Candidatus Omnitrophica bacterium]|nr:tetraacyldisaccharide 4'-kinase [Candidatus Omnitrophota bacterium]
MIRKYLFSLATDRTKGFIPAVVKEALFLFSLIYGLLVLIIIYVSRIFKRRLNCKVISVGNITVGGTGKTALVLYIAQFLKDQGRRVAIVSRGYKRKIVTSQSCINAESVGDEPYMLQDKLKDVPVIVDTNRFRAGRKALEDYRVDTVILDDGLQQWRLKKDLEIVTIDATNPFGNRRLMPRGILRQPLFSLDCADIFVLTKTNLIQDTANIKNMLSAINPKAIIVESMHTPIDFYDISNPSVKIETYTLRGKVVALFSGIGDPLSFRKIIQGLGIVVGLSFEFLDHHYYTQKDLNEIIRSCREKEINTLVTTEKDVSRLRSSTLSYLGCKLFVLRIQLTIKNAEAQFHKRLRDIYSV